MYEIVRFTFNAPQEVLHEVETLEEAQEWCQRDDTHGEGWFDGYRKVDDDEEDVDA